MASMFDDLVNEAKRAGNRGGSILSGDFSGSSLLFDNPVITGPARIGSEIGKAFGFGSKKKADGPTIGEQVQTILEQILEGRTSGGIDGRKITKITADEIRGLLRGAGDFSSATAEEALRERVRGGDRGAAGQEINRRLENLTEARSILEQALNPQAGDKFANRQLFEARTEELKARPGARQFRVAT